MMWQRPNRTFSSYFRRALRATLALAFLTAVLSVASVAHPLGNFTINHYARIEPSGERVRLHYVVEMAEISTLQEMQLVDTDGDGKPSGAEIDAYLERIATTYAQGLRVTVDGVRVDLQLVSKKLSTPAGDGGLPTLRTEFDFAGAVPVDGNSGGGARRLRFEDVNHTGRIGWHELVVVPAAGVAVFNSSAFGGGITNELRGYPADGLAAPLDERTAELSFTRGEAPAGATALLMRDGRTVERTRDRFAELINAREVTPGLALLALLISTGLGAMHALSPGHGKTVVGAYLVGSRGTARHAMFLGLTVTITHTIGVFALGLVTLFASKYVLPERLFPILSIVSGGIVLTIGLSLFVRRLRALLVGADQTHVALHHHHHDDGHTHESHAHDHPHDHDHDHAQDHTHGHAHGDELMHSHGGRMHTHLPPGADGKDVTWRSLLGLGISGGLLPCPSALVVMLSAITLGRVGYGIVLVIAFSLGLAATLTGIGLAFVYARRLMARPLSRANRLVRVLPVVSAFVIAVVGAVFCYEAFGQAGIDPLAFVSNLFFNSDVAGEDPSFASLGALALLGLGLVFGLKHATEVDHVIAVSTIVSEQRNILRSALVGGMWGIGHTASLIVVGAIVLALQVAIPERVAGWLEFGVALMIIGLGASAFVRALRSRADVHVHKHAHDGLAHAHVHFHEETDQQHAPAAPVQSATAAKHSHAVTRVGIKPVVVGAVHGLAGSAALTLLVLPQIDSPLLGMLYLAVFGIGSIVGMLLMSGLVGLPFAFSSSKLTGMHRGLQTFAAALSIAFGLWYAYEKGIANGLLRTML